jgi:hypothetical protein
VGLGIFIDADVGGYDGPRLEGTVNYHREHIYNVVSQARSPPVSALSIVVHVEIAAGHLMNAIVHSLISVEHRFHVGVLY